MQRDCRITVTDGHFRWSRYAAVALATELRSVWSDD